MENSWRTVAAGGARKAGLLGAEESEGCELAQWHGWPARCPRCLILSLPDAKGCRPASAVSVRQHAAVLQRWRACRDPPSPRTARVVRGACSVRATPRLWCARGDCVLAAVVCTRVRQGVHKVAACVITAARRAAPRLAGLGRGGAKDSALTRARPAHLLRRASGSHCSRMTILPTLPSRRRARLIADWPTRRSRSCSCNSGLTVSTWAALVLDRDARRPTRPHDLLSF